MLIAIDQLLWVLLTLGKGHPDETISAAWRMEQQGKQPLHYLQRRLLPEEFLTSKL